MNEKIYTFFFECKHDLVHFFRVEREKITFLLDVPNALNKLHNNFYFYSFEFITIL